MDIHALSGASLALEDANFGVTSGGNNTVKFDAFDCMVGGEMFAVAARTGVAVPNDGVTGKAIPDLAVNEATVLLWQVDPSAATTANLAVTQGEVVKVENGQPRKVPGLGVLLKGHVPIAVQYVTNKHSAAFNFGSTNWNVDSDLKSVVRKLGTMPARDLVELDDID